MEQRYKASCVLVAGFAQLPKGTTVYEVQKVIGCILIIDKETDVIEDATFTFIMDLTNGFISELLKGKSVRNGVDSIVREIEERFLVPPQRAIIQSVRAAYDRYCEMAK